ncbi:hypothetical protein Tco_1508363 [Tanacetum coccineum]
MNNSVTIAYRFEITLQLCLFDGSKSENNDEHQPRLSNFFKNFDSNGGGDLCYQGGLDQRLIDFKQALEQVDTSESELDELDDPKDKWVIRTKFVVPSSA